MQDKEGNAVDMRQEFDDDDSSFENNYYDLGDNVMVCLLYTSVSGGDPDTLQAGPALMFSTIPKVFASMGLGTVVGVLFLSLIHISCKE